MIFNIWSQASQLVLIIKNPAANAGKIRDNRFKSLGQEDHLEDKIASHSSVLAWRIPWIEEPGGLHSMRSQRAGHD